MGILKVVIFEEITKPSHNPKYGVIDMPIYDGLPWIEEHPTYIPIAPQSGHCDRMSCSRSGIPSAPQICPLLNDWQFHSFSYRGGVRAKIPFDRVTSRKL